MENVVVALDLNEERNRKHHLNRGWMNLFRRWAQAPDFRWVWGVSIGTYSVAFQEFCQEALGLRSLLRFKKDGEWTELTSLERKRLEQWSLADGSGNFREGGLLWLVQMQVKGGSTDERPGTLFPVGVCFLTAIKQADHKWNVALRYYRIRDYYRRMGLYDRLLPELRVSIETEYGLPEVRFRYPGRKRRSMRKYFHILERHGFLVLME